ncbi:methyltransferase domain-containing protein, partial [Colletotrichum incanum]
LRKAYDALEPGGWIEFQEHSFKFQNNGSALDGGKIQQWCELLHDSMSTHKRPMSVGSKMKEMMSEAGFSVTDDVLWRVAAREESSENAFGGACRRKKSTRQQSRYNPYERIQHTASTFRSDSDTTRYHDLTHRVVERYLEILSLSSFTRYQGFSKEEVIAKCAEVRQLLKSEDNDGAWPIHIVYGQKPMASE